MVSGAYYICLQYGSEIFPTVIRGQGVALTEIVGGVAIFTSPLVVYLVSHLYSVCCDDLIITLCLVMLNAAGGNTITKHDYQIRFSHSAVSASDHNYHIPGPLLLRPPPAHPRPLLHRRRGGHLLPPGDGGQVSAVLTNQRPVF